MPRHKNVFDGSSIQSILQSLEAVTTQLQTDQEIVYGRDSRGNINPWVVALREPTYGSLPTKDSSALPTAKRPTEQELGSVIIPRVFAEIRRIFYTTKCISQVYSYKEDRIELNLIGYVEFKKLCFWASIIPRHAFTDHDVPAEEFAAVIHNIQVPEHLRNQGIGSSLVNAWESTLSNAGIHLFVAVNIASEEAKLYWQHKGYQIPMAEAWKKRPYYMYKAV